MQHKATVYMKDLTGYQTKCQSDDHVGTSLGNIVHGGYHWNQTITSEPCHKKTCPGGFRLGRPQTCIPSHQD